MIKDYYRNHLTKNILTKLSKENEECINEKSLYELIFKMKHNLNELITEINKNSKIQLNRNKLKIILGKEEQIWREEKNKRCFFLYIIAENE